MAQTPRPFTAEVDAQPGRPGQSGGPAAGEQPAAGPQTGRGETAPAPAGEDRVAELEAALAAAKAEAAANWDKYLRERAEMENYKRRIERTYADLARKGRKDLFLKVLNALDNLDRALSYESASGGQVDVRNLLTGLHLTHQQFKDLLASEGLAEINTEGAQFDPALHEAVVTEAAGDRPDGQIVGELQKGYTYQDELLRPARVRVATKE
jgi:molecular chaperone GrpE